MCEAVERSEQAVGRSEQAAAEAQAAAKVFLPEFREAVLARVLESVECCAEGYDLAEIG